MKLSAVVLREKLASLNLGVGLFADAHDLDLSFENGLVKLVRTKYPEEQPHWIPLSNVLEMRGAAEAKPAKK